MPNLLSIPYSLRFQRDSNPYHTPWQGGIVTIQPWNHIDCLSNLSTIVSALKDKNLFKDFELPVGFEPTCPCGTWLQVRCNQPLCEGSLFQRTIKIYIIKIKFQNVFLKLRRSGVEPDLKSLWDFPRYRPNRPPFIFLRIHYHIPNDDLDKVLLNSVLNLLQLLSHHQ